MENTQTTPERRPAIAEYRDYRAWLRDMTAWLKVNRRGFSYRAFSRQAGYASPNVLKLVAEGKRNLTDDSMSRFARALGLDDYEHNIFEALVRFNQARTDVERNRHFKRLHDVLQLDALVRIEADQYELYSRWYTVVLREMLGLAGLATDAASLGRRLFPRVATRQIDRALGLLRRLELIRDDGGRPVPAHGQLSTGPSVRSLAIRNFHRKMLELAGRTLDQVPQAERDVTAVTVPLTAETYERARGLLADLRHDILALSESADTSAESAEIYQLELVLFPVTREPER